METGNEKELDQQQVADEPKKSKRKLYGLIALVVAVIIYILVPSGAPKSNNLEAAAEMVISEAIVGNGKVTIESYESKKRVFGKWVISGIVSNTSDKSIESIEFLAGFSDNTEYVNYENLVSAGEKDHEFIIKVTGHKGASLESLKIGEVK